MPILRLIAPSGPFDEEDFARGVAFLKEHFDVRHRSDIVTRSFFLAGDDGRRSEEIHEALRDEEADAIVAVRGGHGATRIIEGIDVDLVRQAGKPVVGFSDITALHLLWARAGIPSLHASMVGALGRDAHRRDEWLASLTRLLDGSPPPPIGGLDPWSPGEAAGKLLGGNLSIIAALADSAFAPSFNGAVLFLEDIGERAYRVDRLLTSLRLRGVTDHLAGVVLGDFHECRPSEGAECERVLRDFFRSAPYPVFAGMPAGHGATNTPLILHRRVSLSVIDAKGYMHYA